MNNNENGVNMRHAKLKITKHAFNRAESRWGWSHEETLENFWTAKEFGKIIEDGIFYDDKVWMVKGLNVTTIMPKTEPEIIEKHIARPRILTFKLKDGMNDISISKDAKLLSPDFSGDDYTIHFIAIDGGTRHIRQIFLSHSDSVPGGEYLISIDGTHFWDLGWKEVTF